MTIILQHRRGPTSESDALTGANGEIFVDTTKNTLVIHDGVTEGGFPLPTFDDIGGSGTDSYARSKANSATELAQSAYNYANTIVSDTQIDPVARSTANAAYNTANNKVSKSGGDTINGWLYFGSPSIGNTALGVVQFDNGIDVFANSSAYYAQLNWANTNFVYVDGSGAYLQPGNGGGVTAYNNSNLIEIFSNSNSWLFDGNTATFTTPGAIKTNLINNVNNNSQAIVIDPNNTNLAYFKVDGFDDGGERVVISNQYTSSVGIYFYTEGGNSFRMYQNMFKFADDTWQTTAFVGNGVDDYARTTSNSASSNTIVTQGVDSWQNNQITYVNQFAQAAYNQANTGGSAGIDQYARNTSNTATNNIVIMQGVDATQNANITSVNQYAAGAYASANTNATNITSVNQYAASAYASANTNTTNIGIMQGVDLTQNNNITSVNQYAASAYAAANTNATNITYVNQFAQAAYNTANSGGSAGIDQYARNTANTNSNNIVIIQGVDVTQNTRLNALETVNVNQNTSISIIQGVDNTQNTNITTANNAAWAAFAKANSALANTSGTIFGGDLTVSGNLTTGNIVGTSANTTITANGYISTFDTTGKVTLPGDLVVTGNLSITGIQAGLGVNRPGFRVYGANSTNALTTTQNGTGYLNYNNWAVDYNQGNYLNVVSGLFTAPTAGLYQINLNVRTPSNANVTINQAIVYKNTTTVMIMTEFGANTTMNHAGGSTVAKMAVGDTLGLKVGAGTITFDPNDNWSVTYLG